MIIFQMIFEKSINISQYDSIFLGVLGAFFY